ncbi:MAG: succinate dehydrogenase, cytochrome b556 subunit [Sphingomicrobium sp.]
MSTTTSSSSGRPLSPHLGIYKWGPHMLVSILHRLTGSALTVAGLSILALWLAAIAGGKEAYQGFVSIVGHPAGLIVLAGLTWAFWQHFFSGLRHLVLDTGAGYELKINRFWSVMTLVGSLFATALTWFYLLGVGR